MNALARVKTFDQFVALVERMVSRLARETDPDIVFAVRMVRTRGGFSDVGARAVLHVMIESEAVEAFEVPLIGMAVRWNPQAKRHQISRLSRLLALEAVAKTATLFPPNQ